MDCEGIGALDASALDALRELFGVLAGQGVQVIAVARANERVLHRLERAGLLQPSGPVHAFPTINGAVRAFHARNDTDRK